MAQRGECGERRRTGANRGAARGWHAVSLRGLVCRVVCHLLADLGPGARRKNVPAFSGFDPLRRQGSAYR